MTSEERTILIVEDNEVQAMMLADTLSDAGYVVIGQAVTENEAQRWTRDAAPAFAVVDIDLHWIPAGLAIGRQLMARGTVVLFTTTYFVVYRPALSQAGVKAFLSKPYSRDDLLRSLNVMVAIHRGEQPVTVPSTLNIIAKNS